MKMTSGEGMNASNASQQDAARTSNSVMQQLRKQMTPHAAIAVGVLVLLASVVSGREKHDTADRAAPVQQSAARSTTDANVELDVEKLQRETKQAAIADLFRARTAPAAPAASARPAQQAQNEQPAAEEPQAPPLPFKYLGQVREGGAQSVFLGRGEEIFTVQAGQIIDGQYTVDELKKDEITLTYKPAGIRQSLSIPALD